jgi:hypothetical protein
VEEGWPAPVAGVLDSPVVRTARRLRQLAAEQATLTAAWRDGDELWEWRNENRASQKVHATDTTGETGTAVIRGGRVIAA